MEAFSGALPEALSTGCTLLDTAEQIARQGFADIITLSLWRARHHRPRRGGLRLQAHPQGPTTRGRRYLDFDEEGHVLPGPTSRIAAQRTPRPRFAPSCATPPAIQITRVFRSRWRHHLAHGALVTRLHDRRWSRGVEGRASPFRPAPFPRRSNSNDARRQALRAQPAPEDIIIDVLTEQRPAHRPWRAPASPIMVSRTTDLIRRLFRLEFPEV